MPQTSTHRAIAAKTNAQIAARTRVQIAAKTSVQVSREVSTPRLRVWPGYQRDQRAGGRRERTLAVHLAQRRRRKRLVGRRIRRHSVAGERAAGESTNSSSCSPKTTVRRFCVRSGSGARPSSQVLPDVRQARCKRLNCRSEACEGVESRSHSVHRSADGRHRAVRPALAQTPPGCDGR